MDVAKNQMNSDLLMEMKKEFTEEEQVVFVNSFYLYLNHHPTEDFVIDLDDVYEMIGFSKKSNAKRILENNFTENEDYKNLLLRTEEQVRQEKKEKKVNLEIWGGSKKHRDMLNEYYKVQKKSIGEQVNGGAGLNKQKVMLNTDTFKNLCMIARTEKAKKIRMYYVKMENINMKLIKKSNENVKMICISEQIVELFDKKPVIYLGLVENNEENQIIKYGHTSDIKTTLKRHKCTYGEDFSFVKAIECPNRQDIEKDIQNHRLLSKRHVKTYEGSPRQELLRLDKSFDLQNLSELIYKLHKQKQLSINTQEQEKTKQIEAQEKTKQAKIEFEEKTRQMQLELEAKTKQIQEKTKQMEIELEMKKLDKLFVREKDPEKQRQKKTREKDPEKERQKQLKKELLIEDKRIQKILQEQEKELQLKRIHKFVYDCANETMIMEDLIEIKYLYQQFQEWIQDKYNMKCLLKYNVFLKHMSGHFPLNFSKKNGGGTAWLREFVLK